MLNLETLAHQTGRYGIFVLAAIAAFLALEAIFLTISSKRRRGGRINSRLRILRSSIARVIAPSEREETKDGDATDGDSDSPDERVQKKE